RAAPRDARQGGSRRGRRSGAVPAPSRLPILPPSGSSVHYPHRDHFGAWVLGSLIDDRAVAYDRPGNRSTLERNTGRVRRRRARLVRARRRAARAVRTAMVPRPPATPRRPGPQGAIRGRAIAGPAIGGAAIGIGGCAIWGDRAAIARIARGDSIARARV